MKSKKQLSDTEASYKELELLGKIDGLKVKNTTIYVYDKQDETSYVECAANVAYKPIILQRLIDNIRETSLEGKDAIVTFEYKELIFKSGKDFNDWTELSKADLDNIRKNGEITQ